MIQLLKGFLLTYKDVVGSDYLIKMSNTFLLAFITAILTTIFAFILIFLARKHVSAFSTLSEQVAKLGYSIPGAVVGVGILLVFSLIYNYIAQLTTMQTVVLSGGVIELVYGYSVRFLTISCGAIEKWLQ